MNNAKIPGSELMWESHGCRSCFGAECRCSNAAAASRVGGHSKSHHRSSERGFGASEGTSDVVTAGRRLSSSRGIPVEAARLKSEKFYARIIGSWPPRSPQRSNVPGTTSTTTTTVTDYPRTRVLPPPPCLPRKPKLDRTLYVLTGLRPTGDAASDRLSQDPAIPGWVSEAYRARGDAAPTRSRTGKLGPQAGGDRNKFNWLFAAILEYSCECNPSAHFEFYYSSRSHPSSSGKLQYGPDGKDTAEEVRDLLRTYTIKKDAVPALVGYPLTPDPTPAPSNLCYIMVVDNPTEGSLGKPGPLGKGNWVVKGHVDWLCHSCDGIHLYWDECTKMSLVYLQVGKTDGVKNPKSKNTVSRVRPMTKEEQEHFETARPRYEGPYHGPQ